MKYDHNAYLDQLDSAEQERRAFTESFAESPTAVRHAHQQALREAQFTARLEGGGELKKLADKISQNSPHLSLETAYQMAGKRLGIL